MSLQDDVAALRAALNQMDKTLQIIEQNTKAEVGLATGYTRPHMAAIFRIVCAHYKLPESAMRSRSRRASLALTRQVCMYIAREITDYCVADIAACFRADMDGGTIVHGCKRIGEQIEYDKNLQAVIEKLKTDCRLAIQ